MFIVLLSNTFLYLCYKDRYYARHIVPNFWQYWKHKHLHCLFLKAARSSNALSFNNAMDEIGALDPKAR